MSLEQRIALYKQLEEHRKTPLLVYCTSSRYNASGSISSDAVSEILLQLQHLPSTAKAIDLLLVSNGGDPTVAWRIVSLIREKVDKLSVLVPREAFSAATLIALGADEIVMHPHGNLGPTDPQITVRSGNSGKPEKTFGSEDLHAFLNFARENVGLSDQTHLLKTFELFCNDVGSVPIGIAARGSQLSVSMGEKLLRMHMKADSDQQKARAISERLTKDFFHHGYPVNRSEAIQIGLKIAERDKTTEKLMWDIFVNIADELELRTPFNPISQLFRAPACAPLFQGTSQATIPTNLPADLQQQVFQQILATTQVVNIPPVPYKLINAIVESPRFLSRFESIGTILAFRQPDLNIKISLIGQEQSWVTIPVPKAVKEVKQKARKKAPSKAKAKKTAVPTPNL